VKSRSVRKLILNLSLVVALLVSLGGWILASPVGSDPDGQFHLSSIWCGSGYSPAQCEAPNADSQDLIPKAVMVPAGVALAGTCNSYRPDYSASCSVDLLNNHDMQMTQFNNEGRLYPNVYYFVASKLVGSQIARSALFIRLMNVLLFVLLVSVLWKLAPSDLREGVGLTLATFLMPLGLFMIASNNGSSWTITGVSVYWAFLAIYLTSPKRFTWVSAGVFAGISAIMAAGSRADGAIFILMSTAVAMAVAFGRYHFSLREKWIRLLLPLTVVTYAVFMYFSSNQRGAITNGLAGAENIGRDSFDALFFNILRLPALYMGALGVRGGVGDLGWLDTSMPEMVAGPVLVTAIGLVLFSLKRRSLWERLALLACVLSLIVIPLAMLHMDNAVVGELVQARYLLPLLLVTSGVALSGPLPEGAMPWAKKIRMTFFLMLATANTVALHTTMRRYITGNDVTSWNLNSKAEWWWPAGPQPMVIWLLGSLSFAHIVGFLMWSIGQKPATDSLSET
jgi:hypothetical protein